MGGISVEQWVESLKTAETAPEGFTTRDVSLFLRVAERTARERLRAAWDRGTIIRVGFRTEETMSGQRYRAPVYQYVGGKNGATQDNSIKPHASDCAPKAGRKTRRR